MFANLINQLFAFLVSIIFIDLLIATTKPQFFSVYILIGSYLTLINIADLGVSAKIFSNNVNFDEVIQWSFSAVIVTSGLSIALFPFMLKEIVEQSGSISYLSGVTLFVTFLISSAVRIPVLTYRNIFILEKSPLLSSTLPNVFNVTRYVTIYFIASMEHFWIEAIFCILALSYVLEYIFYAANTKKYYNIEHLKFFRYFSFYELLRFGGGFGVVSAIGILAPNLERILLISFLDYNNFTSFLYYSYFVSATLLVATSFNSFMFKLKHSKYESLINIYLKLGGGLMCFYVVIMAFTQANFYQILSFSSLSPLSIKALSSNFFFICINGFVYGVCGYLYFMVVLRNSIFVFSILQVVAIFLKINFVLLSKNFDDFIVYDFFASLFLISAYLVAIFFPNLIGDRLK